MDNIKQWTAARHGWAHCEKTETEQIQPSLDRGCVMVMINLASFLSAIIILNSTFVLTMEMSVLSILYLYLKQICEEVELN